MSIYVKIFGGKVVKRVIERSFKSTDDAIIYLEGWGVPKDEEGTFFNVGAYQFTLSHPMEKIRRGKDLPDNPSYVMGKSSTPTMPGKTRKVNETSPYPEMPVKTKKVITGKMVVLKEICRQINMEPRIARMKLRKLFKGNGNQRWEWSEDEALKVKEALLANK